MGTVKASKAIIAYKGVVFIIAAASVAEYFLFFIWPEFNNAYNPLALLCQGIISVILFPL